MKQRRMKRQVATAEEWKGLHLPGKPPRLLLDQEQRAFIDDALTKMTFAEIEAACKERFGEKRGLSDSAIHRYYQDKKKRRARR